MNTDITFLTNESERKLSTRLSHLLAKSNQFDCLVGYFYFSGFHLIRNALEPCGKIRILIGLETERKVFEALQKAKIQQSLNLRSTTESAEDFTKNVLEQFEAAEETAEVETGIEQFVRWCAEGKIEVRAYDKHKIHAKLYICTFEN